MKIIDLLNRIANGEKIKAFNYYGGTYTYDEKTKKYWFKDMWFDLDFSNLNDEVEVIEDKPFNERVEETYNRYIDYIYNKEDKKIERLKNLFIIPDRTIENLIILADKINEIIDKINKD